MFQRLLIATDFSDGLHRLVHFIPDLAQTGLQKIVFLHCVPVQEDRGIPRVDEKAMEQAQAKLAPALDHASGALDVQVQVESGKASAVILDAIATHKADLLLLGMAPNNLLNAALFGSTTTRLAKKVSIPVLILRPQLVSAYTEEELSLRCRHLWRDLLLPYDNSESGQRVVSFIQQQATQHPAVTLETCLLCWVDEKGSRIDSLKTKASRQKQILEQVQQDLQSLNIDVKYELREGNALSEIATVALEFDISAIAVSSRHFGRLWELSIPSFTGELMRRSWHPVLFIPPK